jgi:DNA-binding GntR family transcriptional regulator
VAIKLLFLETVYENDGQMRKHVQNTLTQQIEDDIVFGVLSPGARLTEDRIIEQYSVRRHAVRTAFAELKARRMLIHEPNRGVEVVAFTPNEVEELYEIRLVLESSAARKTKLPVAKTISDQLTEIATAHKNAYQAGDLRGVFHLNKDFHRVQFSCCSNKNLVKLVQEYARIVQPIRVMQYGSGEHMSLVIEQHFAIIDAMKADSQERYVQTAIDHLPVSAVRAFRKHFESRHAKQRVVG